MDRFSITDADQLYNLFEEVIVDFPYESEDDEELGRGEDEEEEDLITDQHLQIDSKEYLLLFWHGFIFVGKN